VQLASMCGAGCVMEDLILKIQTIRERLLAGTMIGGVALAAAVALPVAAVVFSPTSASAQDFSSGTLTGAVTDASGSPVAGASVEIRSTAQGFVRNATTDASGSFRAALVPIGSYVITITAPGYGPIAQSASVGLGGASAYEFTLESASSSDAASLGEIVVTGARRTLDFNETTTGLTVDLEELVKTTPIGRSIAAVTLLAPSAVAGDSTFGDVPSIGGSSVAENAFYVNGLNITNFDNYIGGATVPFDFYRSVEVKTGGYAAEFGRATGGIINAVTKSGSNEFMLALHGNFAPNSLRDQSPDTFSTRNQFAESDSSSATIEIGGPIIRDRLFFYGLTEFRDNESASFGKLSNSKTVDKTDDPFYGAKIDAYITSDHRLEFTWFDTTRETNRTIYAYDPLTDEVGAQVGSNLYQYGGESWIGRYTGTFTDWLTLSAAYGVTEDRNVALAGDVVSNYAADVRDGTSNRVSQQTSASFTPERATKREAFRADADIYFNLLGDHHVRAGYDREDLTLTRFTERTGGYSLFYRRAAAGTLQAQGGNLAPGQDYLEVNVYRSGGNFENTNEALYIQDSWDVNDQLTLNLGVRLDKFELNNADGDSIVSFDEEIGPRFGFTYDPGNDGRSRIFGSYGRYYLPVASNTAYRMGASELYYREYFLLGGYTPNPTNPEAVAAYDQFGQPLALGAQVVGWNGAAICPDATLGTAGVQGCTVTGDGTASSTESLIAQNLQSTAEDEFIIGYERRFGDLWTMSATLAYRDLLRNAEDVAIDAAVNALCEDEGIAGCEDIWSGFHQYVIVNPGKGSTITLSDPLPGETDVRTVNFSAASLGYPEATRTYTSLTFEFERAFDGIWGLNGSYTISESKGNTEGYVKSDVGQADAGITQDFDQPGLTDGADGLLPNHRGHVFKVYGSYQLTRDLLIGANVNVSSPRKFGCMGFHPTDDYAYEYGAASWYCNGQLTPRGTVAESDWTKQIDVALRYNVPVGIPGDLVLRADIFNIFNFKGVTDIYEFGESNGVGDADPNFRAPIGYQTPRYVRIGFDWTF